MCHCYTVIALASMVFCLLWYFTVGFALDAAKFFWYYLFFTQSLGLYTYVGQALMSVFRDSVTAQGERMRFMFLIQQPP